jgi:hypothetical protein
VRIDEQDIDARSFGKPDLPLAKSDFFSSRVEGLRMQS